MKKVTQKNGSNPSRRDVFRVGSMASAAGLLAAFPSSAAAAASAARLPVRGGGPNVYERIGVRPFVNCTSTYTINGGSAALPEVVEAIHEAAFYHVNLDELMAKAGPRIAELLGAEAAMVSSGAAGAVTCGTLACVAGGDPEKAQQLPDTTGIRNEVVVPKWSRSTYDHAVRTTGIRMVEVDSLSDLEKAFGPRTVMSHAQVNVLRDGNPFSLAEFVAASHKNGVPVLIDAAADLPLVPNPLLSQGVDLVAYSGGKILRGPQTAGILLGRKDLITAAFMNSAPHHAFARAMKVSKEEIMGAVAAVEALVNGPRDRQAEDDLWRSWYKQISGRIDKVDGVKTNVRQPRTAANYPVLNVEWDPRKIGLTAGEVGKMLLDGEPRVMTHAGGTGNAFIIRPCAMYESEQKMVAERLYDIFSNAPGEKPKAPLEPPTVTVDGHWDVDIQFSVGSTQHKVYLASDGNHLTGQHVGRITSAPVRGTVSGNKVDFTGGGKVEATGLHYNFIGHVQGDHMSGEVSLGEYGTARWTAKRRA
jgi:D-glucosaminate-6-phosphate ammonia-lyase